MYLEISKNWNQIIYINIIMTEYNNSNTFHSDKFCSKHFVVQFVSHYIIGISIQVKNKESIEQPLSPPEWNMIINQLISTMGSLRTCSGHEKLLQEYKGAGYHIHSTKHFTDILFRTETLKSQIWAQLKWRTSITQ